MSNFKVNCLIRLHEEEIPPIVIGQVVWIEEGPGTVGKPDLSFWWIPSSAPQKMKKGAQKLTNGLRKRAYILAPSVGSTAEILAKEAEGEVSFVKIQYPSEYILTDEQLDLETSNKGLDRRSVRKLKKWKAKRDAHYQMIAPLFKEGRGRLELLQHGMAEPLLAAQAASLGHKDSTIVAQVFRRYLLGNCQMNALLPGWMNVGNPGTEKIGTVAAGRKRRDQTSFQPTATDRKHLRLGWKKHKKQDVSVRDAYLLTMKDFYAASIAWRTSTDATVVLLPENERPTEGMFAFHGPKGSPELSAHRINIGKRKHDREGRGLIGSSQCGIVAVGQIGVLDATSEDQQPVSEASRLLTLPSSWRTMLVDGGLNYIFGMYRGFEKGGALAGLLAIENGATEKVAWAKDELGITLEPGELEHIVFKRVRGDAGDLKNEMGIETMTGAEISAEFTRSYAAEHKIVETGHMIMHRTADHLVSGTTHGRLLGRGERTSEPCVTMRESWPGVLKAWIQHNNVTPVPELLTQEMRRANVEPTRQKILQFMREEGYVSSEPYDLDILRAQCMPRLQGTIQKDGIHLFDPRVKDKRYIPGLVYWSEWMHESGLTTRARDARIPCEMSINPSFLANGWFSHGTMRPVQLMSRDPELRNTTLADWLYISDQDSLRVFLSRGARENATASRIVSAQAVNRAGLAAKRQEQDDSSRKGSAKPSLPTKLGNLKEQQAIDTQRNLGLSPTLPHKTGANPSTGRVVAVERADFWNDE